MLSLFIQIFLLLVEMLSMWATFLFVLCIVVEIYIIKFMNLDFFAIDHKDWPDFTKPRVRKLDE